MDEEFGHKSPLSKQARLVAVQAKVNKNMDSAYWCIACITDKIKSAPHAIEDSWSADALSGKRDPGHKGLLDVFLYKDLIRQHLLNKFLEQHPFQSDAKVKIREVFASHGKFRKLMRPHEATNIADVTYMADWKPSVFKFCSVLEDHVFLNIVA